MRDLIRIVEAAASPFPEEIYELISAYVTHGSMQTPDEFDEMFDRLWNLLPRPRSAETLYRVLRLTPDQLREIETTGLMLERRRYSSWTKSPKALERIMYGRRQYGTILVVVCVRIPARNILVDVAAFFEKHGLTSHDFEEWHRYVRWEQEVIVRENEPLRITPDMVIEYEPYVEPEKIAPPKTGSYFVALDGSEERIRHVVTKTPASEFEIVTADGDRTTIRRTADGEWVELHP